MTAAPATAPAASLDGVRVLDLSRVLAGPWATQILGDLGADVIKIERPGVGDDTRGWGPPFVEGEGGSRGDAAYFLAVNRNKRSVTIDISKPEGAEIVRRMVARAHIMVENYKVGGLQKYGLDYASIAAINPAIVYCSITGFGQTGPYAPRPGYDYIIQGMGGLMSVTGEPDGDPMKCAIAIADLFAGMYAVTALLAALRYAERTGQGQHIDQSLLDSQVAMLANLGASYLACGVAPERLGNQHAAIAPYQVFATADGHLILAVGNDGQFRSFCNAAEIGLADDERFHTNAARVTNRAALTAALSPVLTARRTAEWVTALEAAQVPCGPINTLEQVYNNAQVQARGMIETLARENGAPFQLAANPMRMSATPPATRAAPPRLGEHTNAALKEWLAATDDELQQWRSAGAI